MKYFLLKIILLFLLISCSEKSVFKPQSASDLAAQKRYILQEDKKGEVFNSISNFKVECIVSIMGIYESFIEFEKYRDCQIRTEKKIHIAGYTVDEYNDWSQEASIVETN